MSEFTLTTKRSLCPFTLTPDGWVEEVRDNGDGTATYIGTSTVDTSRMTSESEAGLVRAYEIAKGISIRCRDMFEKYGSWAGALAAYQQDLGEQPYHRIVRMREPFLERLITQLAALARKERGF